MLIEKKTFPYDGLITIKKNKGNGKYSTCVKEVSFPLIYYKDNYNFYKENIFNNINALYHIINIFSNESRNFCTLSTSLNYFFGRYKCECYDCEKCIFRLNKLKDMSLYQLTQLMREMAILNKRKLCY